MSAEIALNCVTVFTIFKPEKCVHGCGHVNKFCF